MNKFSIFRNIYDVEMERGNELRYALNSSSELGRLDKGVTAAGDRSC